MATANNKLNILTNQELSIQISLNGLSFCILELESNTINYLKHFFKEKKQTPFQVLDELKLKLSTVKELQNEFKAIHVVYVNELSTLVPKALFNEDALADYLKFNSKILKSDFIAFDTIEINDSVNVYVPYVNINNFLYDTYGAFTYKHYSTILIEQILIEEKHSEAEKMHVHTNEYHFEIIVTNKGNLVLYNTFDCKTKEDFIYYILFVTEQLSLNPETIEFEFINSINEDHEFYKIAYKYIRHIRIKNKSSLYSLHQAQESSHSNFILLHSF